MSLLQSQFLHRAGFGVRRPLFECLSVKEIGGAFGLDTGFLFFEDAGVFFDGRRRMEDAASLVGDVFVADGDVEGCFYDGLGDLLVRIAQLLNRFKQRLVTQVEPVEVGEVHLRRPVADRDRGQELVRQRRAQAVHGWRGNHVAFGGVRRQAVFVFHLIADGIYGVAGDAAPCHERRSGVVVSDDLRLHAGDEHPFLRQLVGQLRIASFHGVQKDFARRRDPVLPGVLAVLVIASVVGF